LANHCIATKHIFRKLSSSTKSGNSLNDRLYHERTLWAEDYNNVMGLDEVGRGCLCGPVVAAGVIFEAGFEPNIKIRDSKAISLKERKELSDEIKKTAKSWIIQSCTPKEIDNLNILQASIKAMINCAEKSEVEPDYLLVDGNRYTSSVIPYSCIIKGDDKSASIAAASILAKVYRDDLMKKLHEEYPCFGWDSNVGYPTQTHLKALEKYGYTKYHRLSFNLRTDQPFKLPVDAE